MKRLDKKKLGEGGIIATVGAAFANSAIPSPFNVAVAGLAVLFGVLLVFEGLHEATKS